MQHIAEQQLKLMLEGGYETRNKEFKSPFSWNDTNSLWLKEHVIRGVLAMTNTPFGGQIIIGIQENQTNKSLELIGLDQTQFDSFKDYDGIKGTIDGYAFSNTDFDIQEGDVDGKKFVIFNVQEFTELPIICRKNGQTNGVLGEYNFYTRSRKAPYSSIRATEIELREIIHMAVDKETTSLDKRGWARKDIVTVEAFYKDKIKDLE